MKGLHKVMLGTLIAGVAVGGAPSAAIASAPGTAAKGSWKPARGIVHSDRDKGGIDVYASRYWSGNPKTNARGYFQSYGEVFYAWNDTATTAYYTFKVNGKVRHSGTLRPGKKFYDNDSFGENKSVTVTVCVYKRGCATGGGGNS